MLLADQQSMSRKQWMMTCVCLSPALGTNCYTFVSIQDAAALDKKPGVFRNCQGIGDMCGATGKWKALNRKGAKDVFEFTECPNCYGLSNNKELLKVLVFMSYSIQCTMVVFFSIHEQHRGNSYDHRRGRKVIHRGWDGKLKKNGKPENS
ncbi:hypothetical protein Bca52824_003109 [Brassica carinata]|uniref:Uncharacterized protein n=1 Tax=Brassica carinata TaxID=52824 RepID=A0A8X8BB57_BRACI|nr:hypothetical protein Bca52824_003109 [Brassica carinata]